MALPVAVNAAGTYTTPTDDPKNYTFKLLSQIEGSGVTEIRPSVFTVENNLTLGAGDTLRFENNDTIMLATAILVKISGHADFAPSDTAFVTNLTDDALPKGFQLYGDESTAIVRHVRFNGPSLKYGGKKQLIVEDCTFDYNNIKLASQGTISFASASDEGVMHIIRNCRFLHNVTSAIGSGSNVPCGLLIENNYIEDCTTQNLNRPFINVNVGGNDSVIIRNNTLIGAKLRLPGGIGVINLLGTKGTNKYRISDNYIQDCRYGIYVQGASDGDIVNNTLIDNRYDIDPNTGGSGINLTASNSTATAKVTGNYIKGSLWGVTIIGKFEANLGKTDDPNAEDYNPGLNVFVENGNTMVASEVTGGSYDPSHPYDLYNNTPLTQYAQGNTWSVPEQTREQIATVIFDKADDPSLGEVIYMSATSAIEEIGIEEESAPVIYYNLQGIRVNNPESGLYIRRQGDKATKVLIR